MFMSRGTKPPLEPIGLDDTGVLALLVLQAQTEIFCS